MSCNNFIRITFPNIKKIKNKAEYVEIKLLVASQIFKELTSNESFSKIVTDEGLQDVVKVIVKNTAN